MATHWRHIRALVPVGGIGLEIGTWKGASAVRWLKAGLGLLYCVDPYKPTNDNSWEGRKNVARACRIAHRRLRPYWRQTSFIRAPSAVVAQHWRGGLDFIYIDGAHDYESVIADLVGWWPHLREGGVMVLDDYLRGRWWGDDVILAVQAFGRPFEVHGRWAVLRK